MSQIYFLFFKANTEQKNGRTTDYDHPEWAYDKIQLNRCVESIAICTEERSKNRWTFTQCQVISNYYNLLWKFSQNINVTKPNESIIITHSVIKLVNVQYSFTIKKNNQADEQKNRSRDNEEQIRNINITLSREYSLCTFYDNKYR